MIALVTGGAGFIGSHLVDRLRADGHEVWTLDHKSTNLAPDFRVDMRRFECDLPFDVVFHLAAQTNVRISVNSPQLDAETNIFGTLHMLEIARACNARFVFASSGGTVYGNTPAGFADELSPLRPLSPYAGSKIAGETYCTVYKELYNLETFSLRLGNVYGPRQLGGETGVVKIFSEAKKSLTRPVIFGDGKQKRDYVHVSDVVDAFVRSAEVDLPGGTFNIGTRRCTSVLDLLVLMGLEDPEFREVVPGDIQRSALETNWAKRELGWEAKISLEEGLRMGV